MTRSLHDLLFGWPQPSELKDKHDVAGLVRLLAEPRYPRGLRPAVLEALVELDGPQAVEGLSGAVHGDDSYLSLLAVDALSRLRDPADVGPLTALLSDPDVKVRAAAAQALVNIGDVRAVPALLAAGELDAVRKLEEPALPALLDALAVPELNQAARDVLTDRPRWLTKKAVPVLLRALRSQVADVRCAVAQVLGQLRDPRAVEPLVAILDDDERSVRRASAYALAEYQDPRAIGPLAAALRSGDVHAAMVLGLQPDESAVAPLAAALRDPEVEVRHAAAGALLNRGWQAADDDQCAAFAVATEDWDAAVALGAAAVEPLRVLLGTGDYGLREQAAEALTKLGWEPTDDRDRILRALARGDWDQVARYGTAGVEALADLTQERPAWIRWGKQASEPPTPVPGGAAEALAQRGHPRGTALLLEHLQDARREAAAAEAQYSHAQRAYHRASVLHADDMPFEELALDEAGDRLARAKEALARATAAVRRHAPAALGTQDAAE